MDKSLWWFWLLFSYSTRGPTACCAWEKLHDDCNMAIQPNQPNSISRRLYSRWEYCKLRFWTQLPACGNAGLAKIENSGIPAVFVYTQHFSAATVSVSVWLGSFAVRAKHFDWVFDYDQFVGSFFYLQFNPSGWYKILRHQAAVCLRIWRLKKICFCWG